MQGVYLGLKQSPQPSELRTSQLYGAAEIELGASVLSTNLPIPPARFSELLVLPFQAEHKSHVMTATQNSVIFSTLIDKNFN